MAPSQAENWPKVLQASDRLRLEAATAEVAGAFRAAGVEFVLLKGASIAQWLYEGEPRNFSDFDVLVRPADRRVARETLARLGFEPELDEEAMPSWWREHGVLWTRRDDAAGVDLHSTLLGAGVSPERVWETLVANRQSIRVGGLQVPALSIPGRALHLALHAAQHGGEWEVKLHELQLALEREDEVTWREAARIAAELEATPAFAAGLRMVPEGRALAAQLELPAGRPPDVALRAQSSPPLPVALGFDQLARAEGIGARLQILRHKAVPPPTFMRTWYPRASQGTLWLALAYAWRPLWLLRSAPRGFRAWWAARRRAAGG